MATSLRCIVCIEPFFGEREPMGLPCGHTLCKQCIKGMVDTTFMLKCPSCREVITDMKAIRNLRPNFQVKESMAMIETNCSADSARADKFCMVHFEPLCSRCEVAHAGCSKKEIVEDYGDIGFELVAKVKEIATRVKLPPTLAQNMKNVPNASLDAKVSLFRKLQKLEMGDFCDDPRLSIMNRTKEDVKKISSCFLTYPLLNFIFYPPASVEECRQLSEQLHSLVDVPVDESSYFPDYFYCMVCFQSFAKLDLNMFILSCHKVTHLICHSCAQQSVAANTVTCGLDGRCFAVAEMTEFRRFDIGSSKEHGNKINPFPGISQFPYSVDLFKHVHPHVGILAEQRTGNYQPYLVDCGSNQVEAITFMCFQAAVLGGIGISNPIENGEVLTIEWVKIYVGSSASANLRLTTSTTPPSLMGGNMFHTDLQLEKEFPITEFNQYTVKLKLVRRDGRPGKVAMYRGNHLTRIENTVGTGDQRAWEFSDTIGFDPTERCLGHHFLTGPILRLIYR